MEANPWAAVVFLVIGIPVLRSGFTNPTILTVYFILFVIGWLACGYAWDWIKYRNK